MFVIGSVLPHSQGSAFYVGDFKMLAEIHPLMLQYRIGVVCGDEEELSRELSELRCSQRRSL